MFKVVDLSVLIQPSLITVVIIVKIIFICSFFFQCVLLKHTFQTNPNSNTNCMIFFNYIASASLFFIHFFQTSSNIVVGTTTVLANDVIEVTSVVVPNAVGTLEYALEGSGVTSVVVNVASRVSFHTFNDIVVGTTTVPR